MKIEVKDHHIKMARHDRRYTLRQKQRWDALQRCPVALAMREAGFRSVRVAYSSATTEDGVYELPKSAQRFIVAFGSVTPWPWAIRGSKPFNFVLERRVV